jgi:hypothetical protein
VLVIERVCQERLGDWTDSRLIKSERTMLESEDEIRARIGERQAVPAPPAPEARRITLAARAILDGLCQRQHEVYRHARW